MDTHFLSFSNPNYQFNNQSKGKKTIHCIEDSKELVDINIMSLTDQKKEQSKLLIDDGGYHHYICTEDEASSLKSDDTVSDEENDDVDTETKLTDNNNESSDEKVDNTECMNMTYGEKPKGILAYISMLEQSACERKKKRKRELGNTEIVMDECDSGQTTPSITDHLKEKIFTNVDFEINSPDSNDSGIQSDARSDDGISQSHGSVIEDLYTVTSKSHMARNDKSKSEDVTIIQQTAEEDQLEVLPPGWEVLPPGWERCEGKDSAYYWHIKSGTIQRKPPSPPESHYIRETLQPISIKKDLSADSVDSSPSTPSSSSSTEDHLHEFEDHVLQYAVKSLKNLSVSQRYSWYTENTEKPVRYCASSLGWVPIAEEDLTLERSNKAVNKCIMELTMGQNSVNDGIGQWGDGKELYMDLDKESLQLLDPQDLSVLIYQPIQTIRVWGISRENGRDFAYVARENLSKKYMCHVFRCDGPACNIAKTLCDTCKKIMMQKSLQQKVLSRLTHPIDLPNLENAHSQTNNDNITFKNASFPTPMEEPKKILQCHYLGSMLVNTPTGMDALNSTIDRMLEKIPPEKWQFVGVVVAPSKITITEHENSDNKIVECRVRYLSFMGISISNVKMCAFIVHKTEDKFVAHVFHCEPNARPLCKTIEAACRLRYQKCLGAQHRYLGKSREKKKMGVKAGLKNIITSLKSPTTIQKIFTDRVCTGDGKD